MSKLFSASPLQKVVPYSPPIHTKTSKYSSERLLIQTPTRRKEEKKGCRVRIKNTGKKWRVLFTGMLKSKSVCLHGHAAEVGATG